MNDLPRQKLGDRIREYGQSLWENPRRLKAFLVDDCRGQYKREIFVLVSALEQGIATDLLRSSQVPTEILLSRLVKRMQDDLGLSEEAARYAVESWAQALDKLPQQQEQQEAVTEESEADSRVQENAAFYCQQGKEKLKQGNYNQAISDFNQAIAIDPNCADAYYGRGEARLKTGGLGRPIKDLEKASELYLQQGKIDKSLEANSKLLKLYQQPPAKPPTPLPVTPTAPQPPAIKQPSTRRNKIADRLGAFLVLLLLLGEVYREINSLCESSVFVKNCHQLLFPKSSRLPQIGSQESFNCEQFIQEKTPVISLLKQIPFLKEGIERSLSNQKIYQACKDRLNNE